MKDSEFRRLVIECRAAQKRYGLALNDRGEDGETVTRDQALDVVDELANVTEAEEALDAAILATCSTDDGSPGEAPTSAHYDRVREFMIRAGQRVRSEPSFAPDDPNFPSIEERRRAANLVLEEAGELVGGLGFALDWDMTPSTEDPTSAKRSTASSIFRSCRLAFSVCSAFPTFI